MVKIGRENWALKVDVTLLKRKRDELGTMNEKLTQRVEALSRENLELKRDLKRTKEELKDRESELDDACKMYDQLRQAVAALKDMMREQPRPQGIITEPQSDSARSPALRPLVRTDTRSPTPLKALYKVSQDTPARESPEEVERPAGRASPSHSRHSTDTAVTAISYGTARMRGMSETHGSIYPRSPSVSTASFCSALPRHIDSDDEDEHKSEQGKSTKHEESDLESDSADQVSELHKTPGIADQQRFGRNIPAGSNTTGSVKPMRRIYRRVLRFNRCEEPDTSDYSSGDEDVFGSDFGGSDTSSPLTPMTASPEPNQRYLSLQASAKYSVDSDQESNITKIQWKKPSSNKRVSYCSTVDVRSVDRRSVISTTAPSVYRCPLVDTNKPVTPSKSMEYERDDSKIPSPTTSAAQSRRRHLDVISRMITARELLTRKLLDA